MNRGKEKGRCENCRREFGYYLIHNGFNESCYAYCEDCGATAILDSLYKDRAQEGLPRHRAITVRGERFLLPCQCGGAFRAGASPRCPHCHKALSAELATNYIEANASGTSQSWKWQRNWDGLYCIVIEDRCIENNWVHYLTT
jgi:hypothetical protein